MLVADANNVREAREILQTQPIDLLLMEARIDGVDCLSALHEFKLDYPHLPIVIFSNYDFPTILARSSQYGASGFLRMEIDQQSMINECMRAIRQENLWTTEDLRRGGLSYALQSSDSEHDIPLTKREVQVLRLLCRGTSNKEIATVLEISYETVKGHVQKILQKLNVVDRTQAALWATRVGLFYD